MFFIYFRILNIFCSVQSNNTLFRRRCCFASLSYQLPEHCAKIYFLLSISSVNVTKSAVSCGFGHTYWRNLWWKASFFVPWNKMLFTTLHDAQMHIEISIKISKWECFAKIANFLPLTLFTKWSHSDFW